MKKQKESAEKTTREEHDLPSVQSVKEDEWSEEDLRSASEGIGAGYNRCDISKECCVLNIILCSTQGAALLRNAGCSDDSGPEVIEFGESGEEVPLSLPSARSSRKRESRLIHSGVEGKASGFKAGREAASKAEGK